MEMDYGLLGIRMDIRRKKELTKMGNKMVYSLFGMRMDRRLQKKLGRMKNILGKHGTKMVL
jgi:hypothetical protein